MNHRFRRHPPAAALGAWFDGESEVDLSAHVVTCPRCRREVRSMEEVRSILRGPAGPVVAVARPGRRRLILGSVAVVAATASLALLAAGALPSVPLNGRTATSAHSLFSSTSVPSPAIGHRAADSRSDPEATAGSPAAAAPARTPAPAASDANRRAPAIAPSASRALRLATIVPLSGPSAPDGSAAAEAVTDAVNAANRDGGVGGRPVQLRVVDAADTAGIADLRNWADAAVGGFGASPPPGVPWLVPADPVAAGDGVVIGEPTPAQAGELLAAQLQGHHTGSATVGAVVGTGPEAGLADAFRARAGTTVVNLAAGSTCDDEMLQLRRARVTAVVLATAPADAARCADAAAHLAWDPADGIFVPPSTPYTFGGRVPLSLHHARSVLGLPWPSSASAGAARFRAAVPGVTSYRALVSFAATELAIAVARSEPSLASSSVVSGMWTTDLLVLDHGRNLGAVVVVPADGRWDPA